MLLAQRMHNGLFQYLNESKEAGMVDPRLTKFGFLIDMDGVIYRGHDPIPGAVEFVKTLLKFDIPFLFLTNNSQRTSRDVVAKLQRMDLRVSESHIFTSAMATARFLARQKPHGTAYVIGEGGLLNALYDNGFTIVDHDPDYVIVGEGKALTLEMIDTATRMIAEGARLVATNLDPSCPTANGTIRPGCGAFVSLLEKATGAQAFGAGKPSPVMFRAARKELGLTTDETIMVGDTMETDILGALQMGYHTALVLTGGTSKKDLAKFPYLPEIVVDSIADLLDHDPLKTFLQRARNN